MCQETVLGIDCDKNTSASGGQGAPGPYAFIIFSYYILPYIQARVDVSVCFIIEGWGGGWGGGSSVNFVMGSWHPCNKV